MFAAQLGQEFLILLREKLPYDVLERIAVHVLPLVLLLPLGTSLALSFFGTFIHHLRLPLRGCFRRCFSLCLGLFASLRFLLQWLLCNLRR